MSDQLDAPADRHSGRGRLGVFVTLVAAITAGVVGIGLTWIRTSTPSSGSVLAVGNPHPAGVLVATLPDVTTPIETGDVVVAMDGRSTLSWADDSPRLDPPPWTLGAVVPIDVDRGGTIVSLDVPLVPYPTGTVFATAWGTLLFVTAMLVLSLFVFWRRPLVPAASALLIAAAGGAGSTAPYLLGQDPLDLTSGLMTWMSLGILSVYLLLWAGLLDFMLVFPRPLGRVARRPSVRLAPYAVIFGTYAAAVALSGLTAPTTLAWIESWGYLSILPAIITFAAMPLALVWRWRRSPVQDRQILRGLAFVLTFIVIADLIIWVIPESLGQPALLPWTISALTGLPFPIFVAVAIVRHGAFDFDVAIRRSLVYGGLTVAVIVVYVVAAAALGAVLGSASPFATSLLATGVVALAALPIRDGLQRAVGRFVYGDRDEPVRAIRRLGERLELGVDPEAMPRVVIDTVADALRLPYVALELGAAPSARLVAERGLRPESIVERDLTYHGSQVGRLIVAPRGPAEPLSTSDLRLLDDLAQQIGVAAHASLLTEDLRASRERLITAREEERRRLRRDLHDGLGPALAGIGMRAGAAESLVRDDPERAAQLLAELQAEITDAVADVRRLVDALRPPAIDEVGLVGALRLAADRLDAPGAPALVVESDGDLPDLPAAVEVAAYRIGTEAMTNAVRHAGAASCSLRLVGGDDLTVVVEDDGRGLPPAPRAGIGLTSMQERAAELGGECRVEARPGGGTRVVARLPLGLVPRPAEA
ncbi:MAG TPA: sensor histidine kinase [Candidatus Limnocylindrales bacterium]|nr:sensor histidine kinase [Candidatus Limnocylindrales bacterium]